MKYLFYEKQTEEKALVSLIYHVEPDNRNMYDGYIAVENLVVAEEKKGMSSQLYVNPQTEEVWYEYIERELTEEEKRLKELEHLKAEDLNNKEAIAELYMVVLSGGSV